MYHYSLNTNAIQEGFQEYTIGLAIQQQNHEATTTLNFNSRQRGCSLEIIKLLKCTNNRNSIIHTATLDLSYPPLFVADCLSVAACFVSCLQAQVRVPRCLQSIDLYAYHYIVYQVLCFVLPLVSLHQLHCPMFCRR